MRVPAPFVTIGKKIPCIISSTVPNVPPSGLLWWQTSQISTVHVIHVIATRCSLYHLPQGQKKVASWKLFFLGIAAYNMSIMFYFYSFTKFYWVNRQIWLLNLVATRKQNLQVNSRSACQFWHKSEKEAQRSFVKLHYSLSTPKGLKSSLYSLYGQLFPRHRRSVKIAIFGHET